MSLRRLLSYILAGLGLLLSAGCTPAVAREPGFSVQISQTAAALAPTTATAGADCPVSTGVVEICAPDFLHSTVTPAQQDSLESPVGPQPLAATPLSDDPALPTVTHSPVPELSSPTPCPPDLCSYASPLFLARPIAPPGNAEVDATYRFGTTQGGSRDPHHGVELLNPAGTPVLATADGVVVVAGDDRQPTSPQGAWPITFYGPYSYFYGNLVVIEHPAPGDLLKSLPGLPQPIYTLYAHLSSISVHTGDVVKAGQEIGKVGMTGIATGSHLHFEVRLGENSYTSSRNPELWLAPRLSQTGQPMGALAARILDAYGTSLEFTDIVLEHLPDGPDQPNDFEVHLQTYQEKALVGQPPFNESFAVGDLTPGWYRISYPHLGLQEALVQVFPGQVTVVTIRAD